MSHTNLVAWSSDGSWIYDPVNPFTGGESGQFQITGGTGWTPGIYTIDKTYPSLGVQDGNQNCIHFTQQPAGGSTRNGSGDLYVASAPAVQSVSVNPSGASVLVSQTQQFTANVTVTGGAATTVTWAASAGTISASGLFTAPSTAQSVTITATSTADTTKSGTATATVGAQAAQHTNLVAWSGDRSWIYDTVTPFTGGEAQLGDYLQIVGGSGWTTGTYQIGRNQVTAGDGSDGQVMMVNIGQFVQPAGQRGGQGNILSLTAGTIAVGAITSTTIAVSSTPPPNASGAATYQWYLSQQLNDSAQGNNLVSGATTANYTFTNLSPGSPYFVFCEETDAQGKNAFIGPLAVTTAGSGATLVLVDGNSIAAGGDSASGGPAAMLQNILGPNYHVVNVAIPAHSTNDLSQTATTRVDSLFSASQYPGGQIHFYWEGSNDLFQDGLTGAQSYAAQIAYCAARRTNALAKDGSKIITLIGTCLPRGQQGPNTFEGYRLALNSLLRMVPSTSADGIVDFAADMRWGQSGNEANGLYYHDLNQTYHSGDDEVHPLDAAYALMVEYLAGAALTVLAQKSAPDVTNAQFSQVTAVQGEIAAYGNPLYQCDPNAVYVLMRDGFSIERILPPTPMIGDTRYIVPGGMRFDRYDTANRIISSILVPNP